MATKCVIFVLILVVMLEQVCSQSVEENSSILPASNQTPLGQGIALTVNNYFTSFIQLVIALNKSLTRFMQDVQVNSANFSNLTEVKPATAATSNNCTTTENQALLTLLTVTEQALAECFGDISPLTRNALNQLIDLLQQGTAIISRDVQNISGCVLNSSHALLGLPGCLVANIVTFQMDFSQLLSQLIVALSNDFGSIGGVVTHVTSVCMSGILSEFIKEATAIIFNFISCTTHI